MSGSRSLRKLSPQARLAFYRNRVVAATGLLILAGLATVAEPLAGVFVRSGVSLGLLAPVVASGWLGPGPGSLLHAALAVAAGGFLVLLGVATGFGRRLEAGVAAALLLLDLPLVLGGEGARAFASFPTIVTVVLRVLIVWYVVRGIRAVGRREELRQRMAEADAEYEAELRSKDGRRSFPGEGPARSSTEEDEYQG